MLSSSLNFTRPGWGEPEESAHAKPPHRRRSPPTRPRAPDWGVAQQEFFDRRATRELIEDKGHPNPRALDTGLTEADLPIDADALQERV